MRAAGGSIATAPPEGGGAGAGAGAEGAREPPEEAGLAAAGETGGFAAVE